MIAIDRSRVTAPAQLAEHGEPELDKLERRAGRGDLRSDDFRSEIYSSATVRTVLWQMQHEKCCFCEREYERKFATVEHFRPKTRAVRSDGRVDVGYWWLAYDFGNLLFACFNCNNPKSDRFPLADGARALDRREHPSVVDENALILDPCRDDPRAHLTFVPLRGGYQIAPLNASLRGRATIDAAKLDRDDLFRLRQKHFEGYLAPLIRRWHDAGTDEVRAAIVEEARHLSHPERPFSLFTWVALHRAGLPLDQAV